MAESMRYKINNPIGILTCQLAPGKENEILNKLSCPNGFCNDSLFFDSLSDFDLIGIIDNINDESVRDNIETFFCRSDGLKDTQLITCFPLNYSENKSKILEINEKNALTITLIHSSGDLYTRKPESGLLYEINYAERLSNSLKNLAGSEDIDFEIYGTLGIPNIVLIQRGNDLRKLLTNLTKIHGYQKNSEALFFHTIPCIHRVKIGNLPIDENTKWKATKVLGEMFWRIGISCYNVQPSLIISKLLANGQNILDDCDISLANSLNDLITIDYAYGKCDIGLRPKSSKSNEENYPSKQINFLMSILNEISKLSEDIGFNKIETKTELFTKCNDEIFSDVTEIKIDEQIDKLHKKIEFLKWSEVAKDLSIKEGIYNHSQFVYGSRLVKLIERFQVTYNIPQMWEIVYDMKDYFEKIILEIAKKIINELPIHQQVECTDTVLTLYSHLDEAVQVFSYSLDQRLAGVELGIGNKVVSNAYGLGNFRTLQAAKAVSTNLFKAANSSWNGFTVFSYKSFTSCLNSGIINMPGYSIQDVEPWIQIGHETGHAYVAQNQIMDNIPFIIELSNSLLSTHQSCFNTKGECNYFIEELLADVFEYLVCFGGNFDKYRETTWRNLEKDLFNCYEADHISQHLLRTTIILFIHWENIGLLSPREPIMTNIGEEPGLFHVYKDSKLTHGVNKYLLSKIESIQKLIEVCIIRPLIRDNEITHIKGEIQKSDIEMLGELCKIIDKFRTPILSLFQIPINNCRDLKINNNFEDGRWQKTINLIASSLSKDHPVLLDESNPIEVSCLLLALQELKTKKARKLSTNLAVLLSLWDISRRDFKKVLTSSNPTSQ